jgi:hypothetical protein
VDGFSRAEIDELSFRLRGPKSGYVYHELAGDCWVVYCQVTVEGGKFVFILNTTDHTAALVLTEMVSKFGAVCRSKTVTGSRD